MCARLPHSCGLACKFAENTEGKPMTRTIVIQTLPLPKSFQHYTERQIFFLAESDIDLELGDKIRVMTVEELSDEPASFEELSALQTEFDLDLGDDLVVFSLSIGNSPRLFNRGCLADISILLVIAERFEPENTDAHPPPSGIGRLVDADDTAFTCRDPECTSCSEFYEFVEDDDEFALRSLHLN